MARKRGKRERRKRDGRSIADFEGWKPFSGSGKLCRCGVDGGGPGWAFKNPDIAGVLAIERPTCGCDPLKLDIPIYCRCVSFSRLSCESSIYQPASAQLDRLQCAIINNSRNFITALK